jgi:hypothetical protein
MYFFVKTNNPRPTFHLDMTADERDTMRRHVAYWTERANAEVSRGRLDQRRWAAAEADGGRRRPSLQRYRGRTSRSAPQQADPASDFDQGVDASGRAGSVQGTSRSNRAARQAPSRGIASHRWEAAGANTSKPTQRR